MKHLYIILFVLPLIGFGQGWEQTFGGNSTDWGSSVKPTTDGGYVILGGTYSFGNGDSDLYLIKTDENGEEEWFKTFGDNEMDQGFCIQQTTDGGYIICGTTNYWDQVWGWDVLVYLIKTDENGEEEWNQTYGSDGSVGYSVKQTTDGGYIITGNKSYVGNGDSDLYLIKTNENGEQEWDQTYGILFNSDVGYSVQQTNDGGYIITGYTYPSPPQFQKDVFLIKINGNGEEEWSQTFGEDYEDVGYSVQQTTDGGYIITGTKTNQENFSYDIYVIKTNNIGEEEWSQTFGGEYSDMGYSVQITTDDNYIIGGYTEPYQKDKEDVILIKIDNEGNELWSQTYGEEDIDERGQSIQQTSDGGYIITGFKQFISNTEVYLIKTDSEGNVTNTSTIELPIPKSKRELVKTTNILGQENTTIKNQPLIEIYDDGSTEKKIVIE